MRLGWTLLVTSCWIASLCPGAATRPAAVERVHWFLAGRVQGVGFRDFTQRAAQRLEIRGWVRNLPDGRVELEAQGTPEGIKSLREQVKRGPPGARVTGLTPADAGDDPLPEFEIRPTPVQAPLPATRPAAWPDYRANAARTGSLDGLSGPRRPVRLWEFTDPEARFSQFNASPAVVEGRVYVGAEEQSALLLGNIYCLDARTGHLVWRVSTQQPVFSSPAVVNGRVYVGEGLHDNTGSQLRCLNAANGKLLWAFTARSHIEGPPAVAGNRVYFGAGDDGLYCLDAATGARLWQAPGHHIDDAPLVLGSRILVGSGYDKPVYLCIDAATGREIWKKPMPWSVWGTSAASGGHVFFGLSDTQIGAAARRSRGRILCLNVETGDTVWSYDPGGAIASSICVDRGQVLAGCWDGSLYCLSEKTGALLWREKLGGPVYSSVAVDERLAYLGTGDGRLAAVDRRTGKLAWKFDVSAAGATDNQVLSSPALAGGHLYIGARGNRFLCIGQAPATGR